MNEIKKGYPYIIKSLKKLCVVADIIDEFTGLVVTRDYVSQYVKSDDLVLAIIEDGTTVHIREEDELHTCGEVCIASNSHLSFAGKEATIKSSSIGYHGMFCYILDVDGGGWYWSPLLLDADFSKLTRQFNNNELLDKMYKALGV